MYICSLNLFIWNVKQKADVFCWDIILMTVSVKLLTGKGKNVRNKNTAEYPENSIQ